MWSGCLSAAKFDALRSVLDGDRDQRAPCSEKDKECEYDHQPWVATDDAGILFDGLHDGGVVSGLAREVFRVRESAWCETRSCCPDWHKLRW